MAFLNDVQNTKPNTAPQGTGGFLNSVVDTPAPIAPQPTVQPVTQPTAQPQTPQQQTVAPLEINTPQVTAKANQMFPQSTIGLPSKSDLANFNKQQSLPHNDIFSRLGQKFLPLSLQKELGLSARQHNPNLTRNQSIIAGGNTETMKILNKKPSLISPNVYLRRWIFLGHGGNPINKYENFVAGGNVAINNEKLPPATTPDQKRASMIGMGIGYMLASGAVESAGSAVIGEIAKKVPMVAKVVDTLEQYKALHPFTKGYITKIGTQGLVGGIVGAIIKNKQSVVSNIVQTAGIFAGFEAILHPIASFFKPLMEQVGKIDVQNPKINDLLQNKDITEKPISNTLLFRNPNDSTQLLRVTQKGATIVDGSAKNLKALGIGGKGIARLDSIQIEAFKEKSSNAERTYNWLKDWGKKKLKIGDKIDFNEKYANATPADVINKPTTTNTNQNTIDIANYNIKNQHIAQRFIKSGGQKEIAVAHGTTFDFGDWAKQHGETSAFKKDRFPISEVQNALKNSFASFRASNDSTLFRYDNKVWLSKNGNEFRVVYTRTNALGHQEVIAWHTLSNGTDIYLKNLGVPAEIRTRIATFEESKTNPLSYKNYFNVSRPSTDVNTAKLTQQAQDILSKGGTKSEAILQVADTVGVDQATKIVDNAVKSIGVAVNNSATQQIPAVVPINTTVPTVNQYEKGKVIKYANPKQETRLKELNKSISDMNNAIDYTSGAVSEMPGKQFMKYISKETGALPEIGSKTTSNKNKSKSIFAKKGDIITQEILGQNASGSGDTTIAQTKVDEYQHAKKQLDEMISELKALKSEYRNVKNGKIQMPNPTKGITTNETAYNEYIANRNIKSITAYHGTAKDFSKFDPSLRGSSTFSDSATGATWFTDNKQIAEGYSNYAKDPQVNKAFRDAGIAEDLATKTGKTSDWNKYYELWDTYSNLAYKADRAPTKPIVKEATLKGDFYTVDAQGKTTSQLSPDNPDGWISAQLAKAKKLGKDGVIFNNLRDSVSPGNKPSTHYAVFDTKNIELKKPSQVESTKVPQSDTKKPVPKGEVSAKTVSDYVTNSLSKIQTGSREKSLKYFLDNPQEINKTPIEIRDVGDNFVVQDGRHRLEASLQLGKNVKVKMIDENFDTINSTFEEAVAFAKARKLAKSIPETYKINTPERDKLREHIANKLYGTGAKVKESRVDIVLGLPAGGKSSAVADPLAEKYGSMVSDSDMAKVLLPEYNDGVGANSVHKESKIIIKIVRERAIENKDNLVIPVVGKTLANLKDMIDVLIGRGYHVHIHLNDIPVIEAKKRAIARFNHTGRFVDTRYIDSVGLSPVQNYDILKTYGKENKRLQKVVEPPSKAPGQVSQSINRGRKAGLLELGQIQSFTKISNDVPKGTKPKLIEHIVNSSNVQVISKEDYLRQGGYKQFVGATAIQDNMNDLQKRKALKMLSADQKINTDKLNKLSAEYDLKVKQGLIREPTRVERLTKTAQGNPDAKAVQVARRLLDKAGVKYTPTEIKLPELPQPSKPILGVVFPGADYVATFIEKDIIDNFKNQKEAVKGIWKATKDLFSPETVTTKKASAIVASGIMMSEQYKSSAWKVAEASRMWWAKIPDPTKINFIDQIDKGKISTKDFSTGNFEGTSKEIAKVFADSASAYRIRFDKQFEFEKDMGLKVFYIINYFPHMWDNTAKAKIVFQHYAESMSQGRFTKTRFIDLLKIGIDNGLNLKTTNPEELAIMREIDGFRIATNIDIMREFEREKIAFPIKDKGIVGFPIIDTPDGRRLAVMPDGAKILSNAFFQPNMWSQTGFFPFVFRNLMRIKGIFVPIKLAISGFHFVHITFIATADARLQVYKKILNRNMNGIDAIKELSKATLLISQKKAISRYAIGTVGLKGMYQADVSRWWDTPMDKLEPYQQQIIQYIIDGGGTPKMSEEFAIRSKDSFRKAVNDENYIGATIRGIPKIIEGYQKPIFESYIPALKVHSYLEGVRELLKKKPELATMDVERKIEFRKLWKSVDNRYGQMNYKNLFWKPMVKQWLQVSFLSLGWNLGFVREFGGGVLVDAPRLLKKGVMLRATKEDVTDKMLFAFDYILQSAIVGGLMTYAMTGNRPKTIQDFFFPQTGNTNPDGSPSRVNTSFYTREYFSLQNHYEKQGVVGGATSLVQNKLNPVLSTMAEIYQNKDYYGYQIHDTNSPVMVQSAQFMDYMLKNALAPISLSGAIRASTISGKKGVALSFLGFNPAPKYIAETPMESKIYSVLDRRTGGVKPLQQRVVSDSKSNIRTLYLEGKIKEARVALRNAIKAGYISPRGRAGFIRNLDIPSDVRAFGALSQFPSDQEHLLSLMTEKELQRYAGHSSSKVKKIISTLSPTASDFVKKLKRGKIRLARFKRGKQI